MEEENNILFGDALFERMKPEIIAELGNKIKCNRRTILMISARSGYGKTSACLKLANSAVQKGHKVLYYDGDEQPLIHRQTPNLYLKFLTTAPEKFNKLFIYSVGFDENKIFEEIERIKPKLIIIDNIYNPFYKKYPKLQPMDRAKKIKLFCINFRSLIAKNDISAVVTTPAVLRMINKHPQLVQLGGDAVKAMANTKYFIDSPEELDKEGINFNGDKKYLRYFIRDRIEQIIFSIDGEGELFEVDDIKEIKKINKTIKI